MPWKGEKDPYKIWLSEIILQQTRVEQGWDYYKKFTKAFPTVKKLATASEKEVYKMWEGLGYYSRCKNLILTARYIANELKGKFPEQYEEIIQLKGVGNYTAAAIASFAYNQPYAVLDGNVFRVLSRIFGVDIPVDSQEGKKYFTALANQLLDKKKAGAYNQAIMDFGAVICKPVTPVCGECPFKRNCFAYKEKRVNDFPVKSKKIRIRERRFYYLVITYRDKYIIAPRKEKDIWQHLYEFPLLESDQELNSRQVAELAVQKEILPAKTGNGFITFSDIYVQQLTHQRIYARFLRLKLDKKPLLPAGSQLVPGKKLSGFAFPRIITVYLSENLM